MCSLTKNIVQEFTGIVCLLTGLWFFTLSNVQRRVLAYGTSDHIAASLIRTSDGEHGDTSPITLSRVRDFGTVAWMRFYARDAEC